MYRKNSSHPIFKQAPLTEEEVYTFSSELSYICKLDKQNYIITHFRIKNSKGITISKLAGLKKSNLSFLSNKFIRNRFLKKTRWEIHTETSTVVYRLYGHHQSLQVPPAWANSVQYPCDLSSILAYGIR